LPVTFISRGYDTTDAGLSKSVWADMHPAVGTATSGVRSPMDWKVEVAVGNARTVTIHEGRGFGCGVVDKTIEDETLQLAPVTTGTRWDLVAARRSWLTNPGATTFTVVSGGSAPTLPMARYVSPGHIDDQPLALVPVTPEGINAADIIDLRCWTGNGGGIVANHELVKDYLNQVGTHVTINGVLWIRRVDENDAPEWVQGQSLYGIGAALHGAPAGLGDFLIQAGSFVGTTDGAGYCRLRFPKAFPNGLLYVGPSNGDGWASGPGVTFASAGSATINGTPNFWGQSGYGSKAEWVYEMCRADGTKAVNQAHRLNWIAIGW